MNDLAILLSWVAGCMLGAFFFAGLLFTIDRGVLSKQPALWFLGSAILRTGVVLYGFYFVSACQFQRLSFCMLGFAFAGCTVLWFTRNRNENKNIKPGGWHHAP